MSQSLPAGGIFCSGVIQHNAEVIKSRSGYSEPGVTPNDFIALGCDAADPPAARLMFEPVLGPVGRQTQHQFKILTTVEAPLIPQIA